MKKYQLTKHERKQYLKWHEKGEIFNFVFPFLVVMPTSSYYDYSRLYHCSVNTSSQHIGYIFNVTGDQEGYFARVDSLKGSIVPSDEVAKLLDDEKHESLIVFPDSTAPMVSTLPLNANTISRQDHMFHYISHENSTKILNNLLKTKHNRISEKDMTKFIEYYEISKYI